MSGPVTTQPTKSGGKKEQNENITEPMYEVITIMPESVDISTKSSKIDDKLFSYLGRIDSLIIQQGQELVEEATKVASLGCCKVETENQYSMIHPDTKETILLAIENSNWCLRNPCLCCVWRCGCCHCDCSTRRPFEMSVRGGSATGPELLKFERPYRSSCIPCCLQLLKVESDSHYLGSVKQMSAYLGLCNCCGLIEIRDTNDDVLYKIEVPCRLCSCSGGLNVNFFITDVQGKDVGQISKEGDLLMDMFTNKDNFIIKFPTTATTIEKALIIGAGILIDYLYYED